MFINIELWIRPLTRALARALLGIANICEDFSLGLSFKRSQYQGSRGLVVESCSVGCGENLAVLDRDRLLALPRATLVLECLRGVLAPPTVNMSAHTSRAVTDIFVKMGNFDEPTTI